MAPLNGAEWRTGWTGGACWRRKHRCNLFCSSMKLLPHPLRPPALRDRRAWVHSFNQSKHGAALSRRTLDEHRLMQDAGAESALQARSGSRSIVSRLSCTILPAAWAGRAVKARKKAARCSSPRSSGRFSRPSVGAFHRLPRRQDRQNGRAGHGS